MFATDRVISRFVFCLFCGIHGFLTPQLAAAEWDRQQTHPQPMDFSLWFSSTAIDFQAPARQVQLNLDRVGFVLREQAPTMLAQGGIRYALLLGYAFSDDAEQAETQGLDLAGQYIGVELAYPLLSTQSLEMLGSGRFIYQRTEAAIAEQAVTQRWRESALGVSLWYRINIAVAAVLEGSYLDVVMAQQASGQITRNTEFTNQARVESRMGLDFFTGEGGWIGVYASFGYSRGLQLKFQRKF